MSAKIIDGKAISATVKQEVAVRVEEMMAQGLRRPGLAVVLVGDDPASQVYVGHKRKACDAAGVISTAHMLPASTPEAELLALVDQLNADDSIDGILVQLPLPDHIDSDLVIERIDPAKDSDGFHPYNMGRLMQGRPTLRPCTPYGCVRLLQETGETLSGKSAVIIGRSNIVGRPMFAELLMLGVTPTVCHSRTQDLPAVIAGADIVIAGIGKPEFVHGDWIKQGAIVIDVGINRLDNGKLAGDVHFDSAVAKASWITPVPGGVGPMTVAMLLQNTVEASIARQQPA